MALQVWLPLNKNGADKNQGLSNITVTNGGATYETNGKLGGCYKCVEDARLKIPTFPWMTFRPENSFSVSLWHKGTATTSTSYIFACTAFELRITSTQIYVGWGGAANEPSQYVATIDQNTWYHIAFTWNGATKKLQLYVNGNPGTERTVNGNVPTSISNNLYCTYNGTRYINDVRIYDHCLSPKEIKEISKGLVLHYPLNNTYVEGTVNLITSITKGGQTTVNGYEVTTSGVHADTYFTLNLSEKIIAGNTYTISCRNNFDDGLYWDFPIGSQANQTLTWRITPGYSSYTFVANSGNSYWNNNTCFMDDLSGTARTAGKSFKMWDWQIEKKDHATPFVIGTRNESTVYDCSGFQNNGTVSGSLSCSSDSPRYTRSYKFVPNAMISAPGIVNFDKCTYSVWCKDPNMSYKIVFCDGTSKVAFGESSGFLCSCRGNSQNKFTKNNWKNSDWNHVVVVRDGSTYKMYINGVAEIQSGSADEWTHSASTITVGGREENAAMWNGNISDFRIYSTALLADDIKELYNTSTIVTQ